MSDACLVIYPAIFAWFVGVVQTLGVLYLLGKIEVMRLRAQNGSESGTRPGLLSRLNPQTPVDNPHQDSRDLPDLENDSSVRYLTAAHEDQVIRSAMFEQRTSSDGLD